jgi:hypothetical protein
MNIAYISMPYRANNGNTILENIRNAERLAIKYWRLGYAVICPHLNTAHFDGLMPDSTWLVGDLEILLRLRRSDAIVMGKGWKKSEGCKSEWLLAKERGIQIIYD